VAGSLTVEQVLAEANPGRQRAMINDYGVHNLRRDAHAVPIDHDRYGTLWRIRLPDGSRLVMVEVINTTPEPDGSRRRYNIRVPPTFDSALAAVAWTFGLTAEEYRARLRAQS
jgi:hypothetical protein